MVDVGAKAKKLATILLFNGPLSKENAKIGPILIIWIFNLFLFDMGK